MTPTTADGGDGQDGATHEPVLLARVVELLAPALQRDGAVLVDGTLGLGGHSAAVLEACPAARVVGIDRDPAALERAGDRLAAHGDRFTGVHATYDRLADVLDDLGLDTVDGVLLDLGVSSMQLDRLDRGFAYRADSPLDMRMDPTTGRTAADVLNTYPAADLTLVLSRYGEEKFARRIADAIVRERTTEPFTTSGRLVELLYDVIPAPARRTGGHPAKRTFQALRMEVNDELGGLDRVLPAALQAVGVGGRVVVESYHSLEDRAVKRAFARATTSSAPPDLPVVPPELEPAMVAVTRGAEQADDVERARNPRAASVRLRAVERVRPSSPSSPSSQSSTRSQRRASGGAR
ncbi:16S rRNA (cytosine(1402)-N(4))-methyltransferase RsmH [Nocardioides sp. CFH 31398]|uniref:16S rRNA (cytosine(1402)-N(4))-methyltransferase RsmH n=1 Tax=Nocardioides sp. CFH 31398 TaxID=2919579 RepID=UPI001F051CDF|nr:16S rRNA (cytosine(1402)-N(4))-methyltransferase RsmH [Nocardioides sp. CFH 31398]MCH1868271.1 16S rRNA (cytosine(1402)-N(4))-methyltransferase RsmH [Nocardioides sp. CFH 31398]